MVSFVETIVLISVATIPPLLLGLFLGYFIRDRSVTTRLPVLTAISAGMIAWFFLDVMADAAFLGLNQGFSGGFSHLLIVLLFPVGLLIMIGLDQRSQPDNFADPAYLAALAIGFHGIAEGVAVGSGLAPASDVLSAIGGIQAAESFVAHKVLEGFTISVFLNPQRPYIRAFTAMLVAGVPTILGSAVGFGFSPDSSFFFALGGGSALWLLIQLIQRSSSMTNKTIWAISLLAGLLLMHLAGLLHTG